jgi:hypothetical protein
MEDQREQRINVGVGWTTPEAVLVRQDSGIGHMGGGPGCLAGLTGRSDLI